MRPPKNKGIPTAGTYIWFSLKWNFLLIVGVLLAFIFVKARLQGLEQP